MAIVLLARLTSSDPPGGLRIGEQYVAQFGELAKAGNTLVLPANLSDVGSMIALATKLVSGGADGEPPRAVR